MPKYLECTSAQVPFKCPSAFSARVFKCLECPSDQVPLEYIWSDLRVSLEWPLEPVVRRCSVKKVFLEFRKIHTKTPVRVFL